MSQHSRCHSCHCSTEHTGKGTGTKSYSTGLSRRGTLAVWWLSSSCDDGDDDDDDDDCNDDDGDGDDDCNDDDGDDDDCNDDDSNDDDGDDDDDDGILSIPLASPVHTHTYLLERKRRSAGNSSLLLTLTTSPTKTSCQQMVIVLPLRNTEGVRETAYIISVV